MADGSVGQLDFDGISELLADDEQLAAAVGLDEVATCDDARRTLETRNNILENGPSQDEPATSLEDAPEETDFRIRGGVEAGHAGTVEFGWGTNNAHCSGALISPVAMITAAHCVDDQLSPSNPDDEMAWVWTNVNYKPAGGDDWVCLTPGVGPDLSNGKCGPTSQAGTAVIMHGPYVGSGDTQSDIAVIVKLDGPWDGVTSNDYLRIWGDTFKNFDRFEGWGRGFDSFAGTGSGTMRTAGFGLDWHGRHHFYATARTPRLCKGDSGGPGIWDDTGARPYALGLWSNMDVSFGGTQNCAKEGGKQRLVRLGSKINWIEDQIEEWSPIPFDGCKTFTDAAIGGKYRRCW